MGVSTSMKFLLSKKVRIPLMIAERFLNLLMVVVELIIKSRYRFLYLTSAKIPVFADGRREEVVADLVRSFNVVAQYCPFGEVTQSTSTISLLLTGVWHFKILESNTICMVRSSCCTSIKERLCPWTRRARIRPINFIF